MSDIPRLPDSLKPLGLKQFINRPPKEGFRAQDTNRLDSAQVPRRDPALAGKKAPAEAGREGSPATGDKTSKLIQKSSDQVSFSSDMKSHLKQLDRKGTRTIHIRDSLEGKFLSFLKKEPSLEQARLAARFASASIWDIIKKATREEDDDEIAAYLLALLMKIHSEYTFDHSERVMDWTVALAEEMGIQDEQELDDIANGAFFRDIGMMGMTMGSAGQEDRDLISGFLQINREIIRESGSLHDIGKMQIPEEIINKQAPLTDEEYEIIKTHPMIGVEIVRPYRALHRAIPGIKHHHEQFNGAGYPDGLRGEDIPLAARLITVTDTFDAMTEDRPYRKALTYADAVSELLRLSGQQFDPKVTRSFVKVLLREGDVMAEDLGYEPEIFNILQELKEEPSDMDGGSSLPRDMDKDES